MEYEYSESSILALLNQANSTEFKRCHAFFLFFMDQIRGTEEYIEWDEHPIKQLNLLTSGINNWSFKTIERWLPKLLVNNLSIFDYQFIGTNYIARWDITQQAFRSFAFENKQIYVMPDNDTYPTKAAITQWLTSGLAGKC